MPQQKVTLAASGLWLTSNPLAAPEGALSAAKNAVIRRRGVVEKRRGMGRDAMRTDGQEDFRLDAITAFENTVIAHGADGVMLWREDNTNLNAFSGTFPSPDGAPTRFAESGGALYATTEDGLIRLDGGFVDDGSGTPPPDWVSAGTPPGLEGSAAVTGTTGWLDYGRTAAYRVCWASRDLDGAVLIGAPSGRFLVANTATVAVSLTRAGGVTVTGTTGAAHGLTTGNTIALVTVVDTVNFTTGSKTVTVTGANTFTYAEAGANVSTTGTYLVGTSKRDVSVTSPIPDGVEAGTHFLQVYRTPDKPTSEDPGEDMALVGEFYPTAAQVTAGTFTVTDIASFANGERAYFAPAVGAGLADSKLQPPLLTDLVEFRRYVFGVVQTYEQTATLTLLSVDGVWGLATLDGLNLHDPDAGSADSFTANNTLAEGTAITSSEWSFRWGDGTTVSQQIENTARSMVRVINLRSRYFYATYASAPTDLPGKIIVTRRTYGPNLPYVTARNNGKCWTPELRIFFSASATRAANVVSLSVAGPHPALTLSAGDEIVHYGSSDPNFPDGTKVLVSGGSTSSYNETGANAVNAGLFFYTNRPEYTFTNQLSGSDWAHSAFEEPDAWPPRFRRTVGGPNTTLYRITPQGDALLFWTSDGLFRLTGDDEDNFILRPLDPSVRLVAPNTVVTTANIAFALTDSGLVRVVDGDVSEALGEPLREYLAQFYAGEEALRDRLASDAFAVGYDAEREYLLCLPDPDGEAGDPPTVVYVFNLGTGAWVGPWEFEWADGDGMIGAGYVDKAANRLYLSSGFALYRERKDRAQSDYQDDDDTGIPLDVAYQTDTAGNAGAVKKWSEAAVILEAPRPAALSLYFQTEQNTGPSTHTITTQKTLVVRTHVPRNASRSGRLTIGVQHSTAQENVAILGVSVMFNYASERQGQ